EHASKYPRRILDAFQDYRNGCLAGREGFLKQRDRTQDQELLRLAKKQSKVPPNGHLVATATSKHKPSETIWRWALDTPSNDAVAFDDQTLVRISGWVLLSVPDQEPRVVVRSNDRTASWPLNVERPDVVEALADAAIPAGALRLCCGFGRRMTLRDGFDLGFEIDGVIHWVGHYPLTGGPIAAV
ncbi:MAG: hypothetical protein H7A20_12725, partial [Rhodanobacteraceae bacterium]|nr:hypothetical protein [Rhodanobacteraceae bacterium]